MLGIILFLVGGILFGQLIRGRAVRMVRSATTVLIWLLLALLGMEVGHDRRIIDGIGSLGVDALIISMSGLAGSLLLAWTLWKVIGRGKEQKT